MIDTESQGLQAPIPRNGPVQPGPPVRAALNSSVVTPSKPERWNPTGPVGRPLLPNQRPNPAVNASAAAQGRPIPVQSPAQIPNSRASVPPQQPAGRNGPQNNIAQAPLKRENPPITNQDMNPPTGTPSGGFFSARAVDLLRENPNSVPSGAPQFDPHAESPSIRKTAGVDHTKSIPISRPMLSSASPAPNTNTNARDYVNPATDLQRRVGAPGAGVGSPIGRGPSVSSYRPLTRPNPDQRSVSNPTVLNRGGTQPAQNLNGKRPPLVDVNVNSESSGAPGAFVPGPNDPKRPRVSDTDSGSSAGSRPPTQ